jgi:hypothetical protein
MTGCPTRQGRLADDNRNHTRRWPPLRAAGAINIVPGEALAEDTRFELVRVCPPHAFQLLVRVSGGVRHRPDLRRIRP